MSPWLRVFLGLALLLLGGVAGAVQPVPALSGRVVDQTGSLEPATVAGLVQRLAALEQAGGGQLAVLLISTTQPETIEQYSLRVVGAWKLGHKGKDDGVLLLLAKADRALRIEVGYGLEGAIPDVVAKRVIAEIMVPRLGQGDFNGAVTAGVAALDKLMRGEALPNAPPTSTTAPARKAWLDALGELAPAALVLVMLAGQLLRAVLGRLPGAALAGGIVFAGVLFWLGGWLIALLTGGAAFVIVLVGGAGRIGGGGFGGGGFGGGGFGGGGGGFGGGGASGRW